MNNEINDIFEKVATELDIPDSIYEQVVERYKSVGRWLGREASGVMRLEPIIYPQGSIQLGTVVKPINDEDQYDIDLVCELVKLDKGEITQHKLKDLIGIEIKGYANANSMNSRPTEGRRCWTLEYSNTSKFHMDILPAIPDGDSFTESLESRGFFNQWSANGIAITDNKSRTYDQHSYDWPQSNPKGYVMWFRSKMQRALLNEMKAHVEPVAQYKIKTSLQQAVQILKRHRDIMFAGALDDKPISVILTTLAAHAYNGELTVTDALLRIVNNMEYHIGLRNGFAYIPNPSNPNENFADKWRDHPQREQNFKNWLRQVKNDFNAIFVYDDVVELVEALVPLLGEGVVNRAAAQIFENIGGQPFDLQKNYPMNSQFFDVPYRQKPTWPEEIRGNVKIECVKSRKNFLTRKLTSNAPVSKHWYLNFEAKTNVTHPYQVFWQVVNTGEEARAVSQLRGEFRDGATFKRARQWQERTKYTGKHWIECFIVKDNVVIARSGPFVVNIE